MGMVEIRVDKSNFRITRVIQYNQLEIGEVDIPVVFNKPVITLFGNSYPVSKGIYKALHDHVPASKGQYHQTLKFVGHFSPEAAPEDLAHYLAAIIRENT